MSTVLDLPIQVCQSIFLSVCETQEPDRYSDYVCVSNRLSPPRKGTNNRISVFGRRSSMSEENVKTLFSTIDDFMDLQQSPSSSMIDGFPIIAKFLPKPLQWYRPKAERIFHKTLGFVTVSPELFHSLTKVITAVYTRNSLMISKSA